MSDFDVKRAVALWQARNMIDGREPGTISEHMNAGMETGACRYPFLREVAELRILYGLGFEHGADLVTQRIREILTHEAAKGLEAQAIQLALSTEVSLQEAINTLVAMQQAEKDRAEPQVH
jgi:hypothetical protein